MSSIDGTLIGKTAAEAMEYLAERYGEDAVIQDVIVIVEVNLPAGSPSYQAAMDEDDLDPDDYVDGISRIHGEPSSTRPAVNAGMMKLAMRVFE